MNPQSSSKVARGALLAFALSVSGAALGAGAQLVLARALGPVEYGVYAYALAWGSVLALFGTLGFTTGLLRFVAHYADDGHWSLVRAVIRHAERRAAITTSAMAAAAVTIVFLIHDRLAESTILTFLIVAILVPVDALLQIRAAAVRALGRIGAAFAPNLVLRPMLIAGGVGVLWFVSIPNAPQAMLVTFFAVLMCLVPVSLSLRSAAPPAAVVASVEDRKVWDRAVLPLLLMDGQVLLLASTDILMLGALTDTTTAGIYAVATRVALLASFPLRAINSVFAPTISVLYSRQDFASLQVMVSRTAWWSTGATVCIVLPIVIISDWVLMLFGPAFREGTGALLILLCAQLIRAAAGSVHMLINMTGNERHAVKLYVAVAIINLILNSILIPLYGLNGAAAATTSSTIIECVGLAVLVHRHVGIKPGLSLTLRV